MRKKIIFLAFCAVLLLIFMSSSYGELDPKYVLLGDPWQEMDLCPAPDTTVIIYDKTATNNIMGAFVIRVLGIDFVVIQGVNASCSPESPLHKPTILQEK